MRERRSYSLDGESHRLMSYVWRRRSLRRHEREQQQQQQQQEGDEGEEDVKAEQEVEEEGEAQETRGGVKSNSQQRSSGAAKLGPRRWHAGPQPGARGRGRGGPQGQNEWDV